jgi:oligopeptide/dipeptide ABC transporter ATP-binding protein
MGRAIVKPLLEISHLSMHFPVKSGLLRRSTLVNRAVNDVDLSIYPGETLGLVGESGCGKTTLGRCIARLYQPTHGQIHYQGVDLVSLNQRALLPYRRDIQMIFQDPMESLNSRHTVKEILEEPLIIHGMASAQARDAEVKRLLDLVGLPARSATRFPFEFSGGQRQRIGIARAIALKPKLIVCDEPVSALDVSIQSQILNLLLDLQSEFGLAYLFIAHDLAVVKHISDRIAIMYLGQVVETASSETIYQNPRHPYTQSLISAIPVPDPTTTRQRVILKGDVPSPIDPPKGCHFHPRCPACFAPCADHPPLLEPIQGSEDHLARCHLVNTPGAVEDTAIIAQALGEAN